MATPTVVLLPFWRVGHLMSMFDAGKRLLGRSGRALSLTVLVIQPPTEQFVLAQTELRMTLGRTHSREHWKRYTRTRELTGD